ncbi:IS630 family transposase [Pseudomonas syringae pv. actinidiae ICMP 9853]|uniref:IS630-like element ISPsy32 family transposase n=1 Tax=Pseudomonas syringae TaxID=317 RepID=UPI00097CCAC9|nr:IS630-like element ISPsy32 family transposase [Pseudomonas syringae]AQL36126.1 IS630 family transposase [Pseudomonas syringae pv. actinidiae ICMP 9853]
MSAQDIVLSPEESAELSRRTRSATISQRDGRRARVILLAAQGCSRVEIARLVGFSLRSVTLWCKRFQEQGLDGLIDKPGRGRKSFLPPDAMARVLEKVVQPRIGQPRWSCRSMAQVAGISPASVQRIWAANDIKPHLTRTFKLSNDPNFEEKFWDVIGLYLDPPDKALVLCCDEKSQVQALERTQPGLPLGIGHIRTQSHDYIRHGTVTLFTALDYLEGRLISSIERQHRHQEWLDFLKKINRETPKNLQLHLIVDNYATHKHPKVKAWLEKHKRFHMHFTPTSSSRMNMVERFFRDITVYLRDGSFSSIRELESSITTFLALRNAQPTRYVWNAKGEDILNKIQRARVAMSTQA